MTKKLLVLVDDAMMAVRLQDSAEKLGYRIVLAGNEQEFIQELEEGPELVLVDTSVVSVDWPRLVQLAKAQQRTVVAFGNHMDLAARDTALAAGAETMVANAAITTDLEHILRKYTAG